MRFLQESLVGLKSVLFIQCSFQFPHQYLKRRIIALYFACAQGEFLSTSLLPDKVLSIWDLHGLLTLLAHAATKWRFIGLALCFSDPHLDIIAHKLTNVVGGPLECFRDMLSQWLRWGPPDHDQPTVNALATALRAPTVQEKRLANELQQSFTPSM